MLMLKLVTILLTFQLHIVEFAGFHHRYQKEPVIHQHTQPEEKLPKIQGRVDNGVYPKETSMDPKIECSSLHSWMKHSKLLYTSLEKQKGKQILI